MVDGGQHWGFAGPGFIGPGAPLPLDQADQADRLQSSTMLAVAEQYCVSFLAWKLHGDAHDAAWFLGEATPMFGPEHVGADADKLRLRLLFWTWLDPRWYFDYDDVTFQGFDDVVEHASLGDHATPAEGDPVSRVGSG
jgi:hypothetical protein